MTRFDQSNSSPRSHSGMPSTSASASNGRSAATSVAKSHTPAGPVKTRSQIAAAWARIRSVSSPTARGVNDRASSRRSREWSGGSMFSIIERT